MNNKYALLICIMVLALAPACKRRKKTVPRQDINTTIEITTSTIESEEYDNLKISVEKF